MLKDKEPTFLMNPNDVCGLLDIKESTLRKYALILKEAGYQFYVNDKGQRGYLDNDVMVLRKFLDIKSNRDMTLQQSAKAVMSWVKESSVSLRVIDEIERKTRYNNDIQELNDTIKAQNEFLQQLMKKMDKQQHYIEQRLEERDQKLIIALRESQELKEGLLQLTATKKQSFFSRLFNR